MGNGGCWHQLKAERQSCTQSLPGADSIQFTTRTLVRSPQPSPKEKCTLLQILASSSCFLSISDLQLLCDSTDTSVSFFPSWNSLFLPPLPPCIPPQLSFPISSLLKQLLSNSYLQRGQHSLCKTVQLVMEQTPLIFCTPD